MTSTFDGPTSLTQHVAASSGTALIAPKREVPLGAGDMEGDEWFVESTPEVNVCALRIGDEAPVVLVSIDALYPGPAIAEAVQESLPGVPPENIIVAAAHTHSAPMLDETKPKLNSPDPDHLREVLATTKDLVASVVDPGSYSKGSLQAASGLGDHSVNRRLVKRAVLKWPPEFNKMRWGPNFSGTRDETITVLKVVDEQGYPIAIIWNYACHPVHFPKGRAVSTHYPGAVREILRRKYGAGLPILFFQGFSGDTRPLFLAEDRRPPTVRHLYRRVRFGPSWVPRTMDRYTCWVSSLADRVQKVASRSADIKVAGPLTAELQLPRTDFFQPAGPPLIFQAIGFGSSLQMVAVNAEPVSRYAKTLRKQSKTDYTMLISCAGETAGYLPTKQMLIEGGYEGEDFLPYFELSSLNPSVEQNTRAGFLNVLSEVGEPGS